MDDCAQSAVCDFESGLIRSRDLDNSVRLMNHGSACRCVDMREPSVPVGFFAGDKSKKLILDKLGDRSAASVSDLYAIDGANRRDLGGRAREKDFVRDI